MVDVACVAAGHALVLTICIVVYRRFRASATQARFMLGGSTKVMVPRFSISRGWHLSIKSGIDCLTVYEHFTTLLDVQSSLKYLSL